MAQQLPGDTDSLSLSETMSTNQPITISAQTVSITADPSEAFHNEPKTSIPAPIDEGKDPDTELPPAKVTPDRIAELSTTNDVAPAVSGGIDDSTGDPELEDLGWSENPNTPVPMVRGMNNEQLWVLVRRFNKQIYEVKAIAEHPKGRLDLNAAEDDQFFPDKLRSTLERVYISVVVPIVTAVKHVARLRSWNEQNRTVCFCATYFAAWFLNVLLPTSLFTLLLLIISPRTRRILFPPVPPSAVSATSGKIQTPPAKAAHEREVKAGGDTVVVAAHPESKDSLTGAAEAYSGQAIEQEASNFVAELGALTVDSATGLGAHKSASEAITIGSSTPTSEKAEVVPTHVELISNLKETKEGMTGVSEEVAKKDKTKKPVQAAVWSKARPGMRAMADVADTFERFANALSPTPPFSQYKSRLRLALITIPLLFISLFASAFVMWKTTTFLIGIGMFGQPIFDHVSLSGIDKWLDVHYPNWRTSLELRNSLLIGVPTNAQLTLTLLRLGEANKAPLPPPPPPTHSPTLPSTPKSSPPSPEHEEKGKRPKKKGTTFLSILKSTTKAGVESALGVDRLKATAGHEAAKARVGVVQRPCPDSQLRTETGEVIVVEQGEKRKGDGPVYFSARYRGEKGHLVISSSATSPVVAFSLPHSAHPHLARLNPLSKSEEKQREEPVWSMAIEDIESVAKLGGLGWQAKLLVGWAVGGEVADGIAIVEKGEKGGRKFVVTAMERRDEAFNRLISMGGQCWESC